MLIHIHESKWRLLCWLPCKYFCTLPHNTPFLQFPVAYWIRNHTHTHTYTHDDNALYDLPNIQNSEKQRKSNLQNVNSTNSSYKNALKIQKIRSENYLIRKLRSVLKIAWLADIQRLTVKDLGKILRCYSESTWTLTCCSSKWN